MLKMKKTVCLALVTSIMATMLSGFIVQGDTVLAETTDPVTTPAGVSTLIEGNSTWKYDDTNTSYYGDSATDFRSDGFDDSTWKTGKGPFGYPADNENEFGAISDGTLLTRSSEGSTDAFITYYFKKDFTVENLSKIKQLKATIKADDGFVIYVNGTEVSRGAMKSGAVTHDTLATDTADYTTIDLTSKLSAFKEGTNKIAVSVHNNAKTSSDIYFDMELKAYAENQNQVPKQVNVHVGDNASTSVNVTYTTIEEAPTKIVLNKVGQTDKITFDGTNSQGAANKFFHSIPVTGLTANTNYEYIVGSGINTYKGTFKTALEKGSKESFKFVYLADTQVAGSSDAKALGATLNEVNKMNPDFVYLAGDVTNTSTDENQWEQLFNNGGSFPNGGQDMFGNNLIAVIQGNHDNNTMNRHINAPAQEGNIVYSYDYGMAKFIMINLETANSNATARERQLAFVTEKVKEAKAAGQWTLVGFHKSIYTGASHVTDSDVVAARKYWGPTLAKLDVDLVLQGHDHVYSRGFVNEEGYNANPSKDANGLVADPKNAPLWMVGGHAGGLKWYSRKNYTVAPLDPIAPNYSFLDVNSTDTGSDVKKEQVIVEIEMSEANFKINTYNFKYDTNSDTITTDKYLYDSLTVERNVPQAGITGSQRGVADTNEEVTYTVSLDNLQNTNAVNTEIEYDSNVMEFVRGESLLKGTVVEKTNNEDGKASIIIGTKDMLTSNEPTEVAKFTFKMKKTAQAGEAEVKLLKADSATAVVENGKVTGSFDTVGSIGSEDRAKTEIYTYNNASDINKDGKITLADLSIALAYYQTTEEKCDIDLDSIVNTKDYIILVGYLAA